MSVKGGGGFMSVKGGGGFMSVKGGGGLWVMVFNASFNNISVISWWSVLLF